MMPEGIDEAVQAFANEVAPQAQPRDTAGRFAEVQRAEPMFSPRELEGDSLTGDTRDAGDDPRLRAREQEVEDGRIHERTGERRRTEDGQNLRRSSGDERHGLQEGSGDRIFEVDESEQPDAEDAEGADAVAETERGDAEGESERDAAAPKYEVTVDGQPHQVTLEEALRGYVRQATFHQRSSELLNVRNEIEADAGRLSANWKMWDKARRDYEEDLAAMIPREPDWDQEFARDPRSAHDRQKTFQILYSKLNQSRQARAERDALEAEETNRRTQKYAVEGFARFVAISKIADEPTLKKELRYMRQTAMNAGFSEYEVATVYDPRMLVILRKASKYDRALANRPRAVATGQGRSITPGAATPLGNVRRAGYDEAQRRLAQSGKVSDAAEVFKRLF
jgi:hypothetical protein